jgi:IS5 family transposase
MKTPGFVPLPYKNRIVMIKKVPSATSRDLFRTLLSDLINLKHEPALPADKIEWAYFENEFKSFYSEKPSCPAMPIRLMVGV